MQRDRLCASGGVGDEHCEVLLSEETVDALLAVLVKFLVARCLDCCLKVDVSCWHAPVDLVDGRAESVLDELPELVNVAQERGPDDALALVGLQLGKEVQRELELRGKLAELAVAVQSLEQGARGVGNWWYLEEAVLLVKQVRVARGLDEPDW